MTQAVQEDALLRQYVEHGDEGAFAQIVAAHVDLVYSACLRQLHNHHQAQEATQAVFIVLAQKASKVCGPTSLPGWLVNTARFVCCNARKVDARRRFHERKAAEAVAYMTKNDPIWDELSPELDEALATLAPKERDAIVLRYLQQMTIAQTGASLGISEDAAGMRISRGLEKLRRFFASRQVMIPASAIGGLMMVHGVRAAPPQLAPTVCSTVSAALQGEMTAEIHFMVNGALKMMAIAKAKFVAVVMVIVLIFLAAVLWFSYWITRPHSLRLPISFSDRPPSASAVAAPTGSPVLSAPGPAVRTAASSHL